VDPEDRRQETKQGGEKKRRKDKGKAAVEEEGTRCTWSQIPT